EARWEVGFFPRLTVRGFIEGESSFAVTSWYERLSTAHTPWLLSFRLPKIFSAKWGMTEPIARDTRRGAKAAPPPAAPSSRSSLQGRVREPSTRPEGATMLTLREGDVAGSFKLRRRFAHGGFGEVWVAQHSLSTQFRAVKVVPSDGLHGAVEREGVCHYV